MIEVPCRHFPHSRRNGASALSQRRSGSVSILSPPCRDDGDVVLDPGARALIPTGLALELPNGFEAQVRPRSGLALKEGVTVLNSPGTIDSDYRGEIGVILINFGQNPVSIRRGARIAQLVVNPVERITLIKGKALNASERGARGFGSTGRSDEEN